MRSCPDEWISYLNSRKSQKFNVVHLGLAPRWLGGCNQFGETPFSDQASCAPPVQDGNLDCADPNGGLPMAPDAYPTGSSTPRISYWERLDKMVQTANSQGLVVFIAGVAKPVQDNPGIAAAVPFARFLAARLAGNFVVMSPGLDDKLDTANLALVRAVGAAIAAAAPRMIVTNHSGTHPVGDLAALHPEPWLGFQMFQSGYFGGEPETECNDLEAITQRPVTMPQALRNYPPIVPGFSDPSKPAINGEAAYEEGGEVGNPAIDFEDGDHRNRYRARQAAYSSWLAGATGYSLGVGGAWDWGICGDEPWALDLDPGQTGVQRPRFCMKVHDPQHPENDGFKTGYRSYANATARPISGDLTRLRDKLSTFSYGSLVTNEQGRVDQTPVSAGARKPTVARDANTVLVYTAGNNPVKVRLANTGVSLATATFFRPLDGTSLTPENGACSTSAGVTECGIRNYLGEAPDARDRLLIIRRSAAPAMVLGGTEADVLEAWSDAGEDGLMPGVYVQLLDSGGVPRREAERFVATTELPALVDVARDGNGRFAIVWEDRDVLPSRIGLRCATRDGLPDGSALFLQSEKGNVDLRSPTVSLDDRGDGLLAWLRLGDTESPDSLEMQLLGPGCTPLGSPKDLELGAASAPRLACASSGTCFLSWVERVLDKGVHVVRAALFTPEGETKSEPWTISESEPNDTWVYLARPTAGGDFEVRWEAFGDDMMSLGRFRRIYDSEGSPLSAAMTVEDE